MSENKKTSEERVFLIKEPDFDSNFEPCYFFGSKDKITRFLLNESSDFKMRDITDKNLKETIFVVKYNVTDFLGSGYGSTKEFLTKQELKEWLLKEVKDLDIRGCQKIVIKIHEAHELKG